MNLNVAKTLAVFGITGALVLSAGAPALAAESASAAANSAGPVAGRVIADVIAGVVDDATLATGGSVDAAGYLPNLDETVEWTTCGASTYGIGDGLMGSGCSDGSTVTETSMGVAHKTLPLGTKIQIVYDGTVVNATVCDRGPYIAGRDIDLQPAVATALGFDGVGDLQYRVIS
jgi:rare lipoprotein A (peptidoglycan hydrolase)